MSFKSNNLLRLIRITIIETSGPTRGMHNFSSKLCKIHTVETFKKVMFVINFHVKKVNISLKGKLFLGSIYALSQC